jgi:hypothetical protein
MTLNISNACSARGWGALAHASSRELYVDLRAANPFERIDAKTSSATSAKPPFAAAPRTHSYVSREGEMPAATISSYVRATRSDCFAREAASNSAWNAAGGGAE